MPVARPLHQRQSASGAATASLCVSISPRDRDRDVLGRFALRPETARRLCRRPRWLADRRRARRRGGSVRRRLGTCAWPDYRFGFSLNRIPGRSRSFPGAGRAGVSRERAAPHLFRVRGRSRSVCSNLLFLFESHLPDRGVFFPGQGGPHPTRRLRSSSRRSPAGLSTRSVGPVADRASSPRSRRRSGRGPSVYSTATPSPISDGRLPAHCCIGVRAPSFRQTSRRPRRRCGQSTGATGASPANVTASSLPAAPFRRTGRALS